MMEVNIHRSSMNTAYCYCEKCKCAIFHINIENYCPRCGGKIIETIETYDKRWLDIGRTLVG